MNTQDQNITDVEFKEVAVQAADVPVNFPDPVAFLTQALTDSGYANPTGWEKGLHESARDVNTPIDQRLFLVNRSLALFLSEIKDCGDNIIPRMFISERQTFENWSRIIIEGIVPWLNKRFDSKGKLIPAPTVVTQGEDTPGDGDDEGVGINLPTKEVVGSLESGESLEIAADPEADQLASFINPAPKNYELGVKDRSGTDSEVNPASKTVIVTGEVKTLDDAAGIPLADGIIDMPKAWGGNAGGENLQEKVSMIGEVKSIERTEAPCLNLTDDEKAVVRMFMDDSSVYEIVLGDRVISKIHRNGANATEWHHVDNPNVFYPVSLTLDN